MRTTLRISALLCAALLTVAVIGPVASPASAATAARATGSSASWLQRQLTGGLVHNDQYDFDDYGLTADTAIALAEIGGHRATLQQIRHALAKHVGDWTTYNGEIYAGSVAKAAVVAEITHADPHRFGGANLIKQLSGRVSAAKRTRGRIQDKAATDYANVIGQALAVQALSAAHAAKAAPATRFLLEQQCGRGFFRLNFSKKTAAKQACGAGSAPDTDVTALAVTSLRTIKHPTKAVTTSIRRAVAWLARHQQRNGSFGGGTSTKASNANSTGLAGWVLGKAGDCGAARKAARWVQGLQVSGDVSGTPLQGQRGAIAYDRAALRAGRRSGIRADQQDQWRRATTQAAPVLTDLTLASCRK